MAVLPKPYRLLRLANAQSARLRVERFELGQMLTDATPEKPARTFDMVRLYGPRLDRAVAWGYHDVTSVMARAWLVSYLEHTPRLPREVVLTAYGAAMRKRYVVEVA